MSSTSYAVLAKARSKYGRFMTDRDYSSILACQSVAEVMVYLKSHTHFASVLSEVNERDVHRGRLEMLLRQYLFNEFDTLCRYDSSVSVGFSRYVVEKTEVEQIIRFLVLLNSHSTEKFIFQFPAFLSKHTELDVNKMANARDYEEFLSTLSRTPYHEILKIYRPDEKGRLPVSEMENKLYDHIMKHMLEFINKKTKGAERQELMTMFKTINDYSIFSRILRLKKYYNLPPEIIKTNMSPEYCSLSPKLRQDDRQDRLYLRERHQSAGTVPACEKEHPFFQQSFGCDDGVHVSVRDRADECHLPDRGHPLSARPKDHTVIDNPMTAQ